MLEDNDHKEVQAWAQEVLAAVGGSKEKATAGKAASSSGSKSKKGQSKEELRKLVSALW